MHVKKHKQFLYLSISILSLVLFIIVAQWLGLDVLMSFSEMVSIGPFAFLALFLITVIELVTKLLRFKYALTSSHSALSLALPYLNSIFISFIIPSRFAGEGARLLAFRSKPKIAANECLSAISIERIFDVMFLPFFLFGAISALFHPLIPYALVIGLAMFLALAATKTFVLATSLIPHKGAASFLAGYFTSLRKVISDRKRFALISILTILGWLCTFVRLWLIIIFIGSSLPFFEAASASSAAYLFSVLSILPGGGVFFEGGGTAALIFFGIPPAKALSAFLLERFFAYWIFIIIGLFTFPNQTNVD